MSTLEIAGTPAWRPHVLPHLEGEEEAPEILRLEGLSHRRRWAASGRCWWRCRRRRCGRVGGSPWSTCTTGRTCSIRTPRYAGDWGVGGTLAHYARKGRYAIVVAVYNGRERRIDEYAPFADMLRRGGGGGRVPRLPGRPASSR